MATQLASHAVVQHEGFVAQMLVTHGSQPLVSAAPVAQIS
jgi:hypothetical protein